MKKKRAYYKTLMCVWLLVPTLSFADNLSLSDVISATRIACSSISDELTDLKKMAGHLQTHPEDMDRVMSVFDEKSIPQEILAMRMQNEKR